MTLVLHSLPFILWHVFVVGETPIPDLPPGYYWSNKGGVGGGNHNAFGSSSWNVKELRQYLSKHKIPYKRKPKPALLQLVQTHERSAGLGPAGPEATVQLATTDMAWNKVNAR